MDIIVPSTISTNHRACIALETSSGKHRDFSWGAIYPVCVIGDFLTLCGTNISSPPISMRLCVLKFFGVLITYLFSDFRNSKWRTQYGGWKSTNSTYFHATRYLKVFCIADHESIVRFPKLKIADPIWREQKSTINKFSWNYIYRFLASLITIPLSDFRNQNGGSNMVDSV